ncbi:hypothetical protein Aduo_005826 [Ancylostoma duodenale]
MRLYLPVFLFLLVIHVSYNCVPTISTTTPVCCPLLSQTTLPRRAPSSTAFQQCSILRRVSSNCPVDGFVFCDAAPETNPTTMQIEFFNSTGNVVRTIQRTGTTLTARVFCFNGLWWVRTAATANTNVTINTVSCSQTGSTGTDQGYVVGTALD